MYVTRYQKITELGEDSSQSKIRLFLEHPLARPRRWIDRPLYLTEGTRSFRACSAWDSAEGGPELKGKWILHYPQLFSNLSRDNAIARTNYGATI